MYCYYVQIVANNSLTYDLGLNIPKPKSFYVFTRHQQTLQFETTSYESIHSHIFPQFLKGTEFYECRGHLYFL